MKRQRGKSPLRLTRDAERLISLSTGLAASGSRAEDRYWEAEMETLVVRLMSSGNDAAIEAALDHTYQSNIAAYDALIELIESSAEGMSAEIADSGWDFLLIAIPLVAWSRYAVPAGPINREALDNILPHLHAHVLADQTRAAISPFLYSIDQMPRDFSTVRKLVQKLGEAAVAGTTPRFDFSHLPDTAPLAADTRFLLATVAAPAGRPLFRWQEMDAKLTRTDCLERWIAQCRPNLARLLPGCAFECLLPDAYFANCRESDRRVRPYTVRAAVSFLEDTLKTTPQQLRAVVAGFGEERVDEYRIAFTRRGHGEAVHGIVWPLFGREDDELQPAPGQEVEAVLKECNVGEITRLPGLFPPEFCEDCGAPLFADAEGEIVHPELPEEAETGVPHYH